MTTPTPEQLTITPHFIEQMKLAVKNPTIEGRCPVSPAELTALIAAAERCERYEKALASLSTWEGEFAGGDGRWSSECDSVRRIAKAAMGGEGA